MISTRSIKELNIRGSEITAIILTTYLKFKYGNLLEVHSQNFQERELLVDDGDYRKFYEIVDYIFSQSVYKDDVLIADITGGTKMMSVALAMACIPPKRKMQYMDSQRDWGSTEPVM